jgi:hypothetical protein
METKRLDFVVEEAGCLIWVAPRSLGGLTPEELGQAWEGQGPKKVRQLVEEGAMMPMSLYQDDGYLVRFVVGDLTAQEEAEWTARVRWKLNVPCGEVLVSGILSCDFEDEFAEIAPAEDNGSYWAGAYVEVPPGEYLAEVYSYPPGDLSGAWGAITNPRTFGRRPGLTPEKEADYFRRTRPGQEPPDWLTEDFYETYYVNFVVRLTPLAETPPPPDFEEDGCLNWEFRQPELCPLGLRTNFTGE